jgi:Sulfatase
MSRRIKAVQAILAIFCVAGVIQAAGEKSAASPSTTALPASTSDTSHPNILFVIMDDVGIDQMHSFGYGGPVPPKMPVIDTIADHGIKFRNAWSMPECSPARAAFFTGRWPLRNNIFQAIGSNDLNNSQVATWEITPPKLLEPAHYESGMIGKFHLGGPENNEAGNGAPASVGFTDFYGWLGGLPASIDTTAGLRNQLRKYDCGFVPTAVNGGADSGACYNAVLGGAPKCIDLSGTNQEGDSAGLQCLTQGGVMVPHQTCEKSSASEVNFNIQNAHYVSQLVVNRHGEVDEANLKDPRTRGFRATIEVDAAIDWINSHIGGPNPWMATVSFSVDHSPFQPPPGALLSPETQALVQAIGAGKDCTSLPALRVLSNAMIEAMDTEFGRLLVETGLATRNGNGDLVYDPSAKNTVIVIVGDNGSLGQTVKMPFDPSRAKATAYQTGVWVPLIVAGPMVVQPGRQVDAMVNEVDIFQLFGEIAGIDVKNAVPRPIDSYPMMAYLTNPSQESLRTYNFTQGGLNLQKDGAHNGPCVIQAFQLSPAVCTQTPVSKSVCEDNGGVWWGKKATDPSTYGGGLNECWQVNQSIYKHNRLRYSAKKVTQNPQTAIAVRNQKYKLVYNQWEDYNIPTDGPITIESTEFYKVNEEPGNSVLIDKEGSNLLSGTLTRVQQSNFDALQHQMDTVLASAPACPGDGNGDGKVNNLDVTDFYEIFDSWGLSSHYDFNLDGETNLADLAIIQDHIGPCPKPPQ